MSITLIGPGGAGKSTVGRMLADRLGVPFVDLDQQFNAVVGDVGDYIERCGYRAYARQNVATCDAWLRERHGPSVVALSSGFMTYPRDIHPEYARLREAIENDPATFVLIPSRDSEACIVETVRRQLTRPFARSAAREEAVIRERFPIYVGLRARKIETMRPTDAIVDELTMLVRTSA